MHAVHFAGAIAFALLLFTPGAWISFGFRLPGIPFWARLYTAALLSPLLVCIEFYALRLIGFPFVSTAVPLVVLNLPGLYLICRYRVRTPGDSGGWVISGAAITVAVGCVAGLLAYPSARLFAPHGWIHADPVYMLARGRLILEDPTLAGIRLSYPPWGPLVLPAVQSYLLQSPPISNYIWTDLVWLIAFCAFGAGIAREMGGGKLAQISSAVWVLLGLVPIGYLVNEFIPGGVLGYCCDSRYVEPFTKFELFGPMALGLAMLMGLTWFLVRAGPLTTGILLVIFLLLSGIGLLYPLLFPPACCAIGARALALLLNGDEARWPAVRKEWVVWAVFLVAAGALTFLQVKFLMVDRHTADKAVSLSGKSFAAKKLLSALIVTSVLLCGWLFTVRSCWKSHRMAGATLTIAAASSYLLYALAHIPFYDNEYKFVFSAGMCVAVFPGLAMEKVWKEWPRTVSIPVLALLTLLVLAPYGRSEWVNWPAVWTRPQPGAGRRRERTPLLDTSGFYLRLDRSEPWAGICDAVLRITPPETVLVVDEGTFYYAGLTGRSLYVSAPNRLYAGVNVLSDVLDADVRGYGRDISETRRATQAELFGADDCCRRDALNKILALKRPVAIIVEPRHTGLTEWLKHLDSAKPLYTENSLTLWVIRDARF